MLFGNKKSVLKTDKRSLGFLTWLREDWVCTALHKKHLNEKDYHKEKNNQMFSISAEHIIGNGLRLQHNGGYEYESIS